MQHQSWPCCVHEYNEWMAVVKRDYIVSDERLLLRTVVVVVCLFSCRSFVHVAPVCFVVHQFELAYDVFRKCILRVYFWSGVFAPPALLTAACHRAVGSYYGRLETKIVPRTALRHRYGNWTLEEWRVLFGMACLSGPSHLLQQLYQSFDCFPRYPLPLSNQSGTHWLRAPQLFLLKSMTTTNSSFARLRFSTNAAYASNKFYHFG